MIKEERYWKEKEMDKQTLIEVTVGKYITMADIVRQKAASYINSGAMDLSKYKSDDGTLAKVLLHVILGDLKDSLRPLSDEARKEVQNLKHF